MRHYHHIKLGIHHRAHHTLHHGHKMRGGMAPMMMMSPSQMFARDATLSNFATIPVSGGNLKAKISKPLKFRL